MTFTPGYKLARRDNSLSGLNYLILKWWKFVTRVPMIRFNDRRETSADPVTFAFSLWISPPHPA
jgi:hypothetical protein